MNSLVDLPIVALTGATIFLVLLFRFLNARKAKNKEGPIIELEKLVNCTSCGSLVPEAVSKCAFCGATQRKPT